VALNGRLPDSLLAYLGWPEADHLRLIPAAAASITRLAAAFEAAFSKPLYLSDAYRTYAQQVSLKVIKGVFAATPGTSNHGLGLAIDVASRVNVDGSAEHRWFEANALPYGWVNPAWAQDYNSNNGQHEPWHWEYHFDLDTHPTSALAQEDDMPISEAEYARLAGAMQATADSAVRGLIPLIVESVWGRQVTRVLDHPSTALQDMVDGTTAALAVRETVGNLTGGGAAGLSDADLARVAQACANEADRRAFARLSD